MAVQLRKKFNSDGTVSQYLDIYHNGKRSYEFLSKLKLLKPARTPFERKTNKENIQLAEQIKTKRSQELTANDYQVTPSFRNRTDFTEYFENFANRYTKKDKRVIISALYKFREFLRETGRKTVSANQVNESFVIEFKEYLESKLNGESPANYFSKFKRVLKHGTRERVFLTNPSSEVTIKKRETIQKEILSIDEIQQLAKTPSTNDHVKSAFIFSCFTGLRHCDIISLKWGNVDLVHKKLSIVQQKTGIRVNVNLHDTAIEVLNGRTGKPDSPVFTLPSHVACGKDLKVWVKKAGINKKITWHCSRHSFGTNLLFYGADIITTSNLLGHSDLKYTQRYVRIVNSMKQKAISNLPTISNLSSALVLEPA